jgi:hypothetical protein
MVFIIDLRMGIDCLRWIGVTVSRSMRSRVRVCLSMSYSPTSTSFATEAWIMEFRSAYKVIVVIVESKLAPMAL